MAIRDDVPLMGPSGMPVVPDRTPEHARAAVAAYAALEQAQSGPVGPRARALLGEAAARGWHDVACLLHYADYAHLQLAGADLGASLRGMTHEAERSRDDALVALVTATRGELPGRDLRDTSDAPDAELAVAVALLDDGRGSSVHRPVAYVACALGYGLRGLWELEEEMYARADEALAVQLPPPLDLTQPFTRRVVAVNRVEAHAAWTCGLLEAGLLDDARRRASHRPRLSSEVVADLPPQWARDVVAVTFLLSAIAGEPEPAPLAEVVADAESAAWPGYVGCALLGGAVRALDLDDQALAGDLAEQALKRLGDDYLPTVRLLALNVAARVTASAATSRYLEDLTALRWTARLRMLGAARARLDAERIRLDHERLTERAYLDELTGVANRHAYARHLGRLRRSRDDQGVAVLMIDVDHFKSVNDRFGHHVGDDVLRRVAALLTERSRPSDLVARLGGDEFVLVLDGVHRDDAHRRGKELVRAVLDERWSDLAGGLRVTVSAGLACGGAPDVDELLSEADRRLYEAKSQGRARLAAADA